MLLGTAVILKMWSMSTPAYAQRAQENAVAEAEDAFGTVVGREEIGLYSATNARGFSPTQAGNLRIDGLYFDQVARTNMRTIRGSSVHVGISAQGFPFPAPTGVVDFKLRAPGGEAGGGVLFGVASYSQAFIESDAQAPIIANDVLNVGGGAGYQRNSAYNIANASDAWTAGAIARWRPSDRLTLTPFWSMQRTKEYGEKAHVFIGDTSAPRYRAVDLMPQMWALFGNTGGNFGSTALYEFNDALKVEAGVFRSWQTTDQNVDPLLTDLGADGRGNYSISISPVRKTSSTSGEVRLSYRLSTAETRSTFYLGTKGRDRSAESGGADIRNFGQATTRVVPIVPQYTPTFGPKTLIETQQFTPAIGYEGILRNVGQISIGAQKSYYKRTIYAPNGAPISGKSTPWLYNIGVAGNVMPALSVYASYTRGFEEIGNAPLNAVNRDEAVPAQLTSQVDAGIKYQIMPRLALVSGVFQIKKPYFTLDTVNFFRRVGTTQNRGAEVSLAGAATPDLTIVAGLILIDPTVHYDTGATTGPVERVAIGPIPGFFRANIQYRPPQIPGLTLDTKIESTSKRYATLSGIRLPRVTTIDAGVRYNMRVFGKAMTARLQGFNLTNEYSLTPQASGAINSLDARKFELSLAVDF
jgi:iron complex outermembrane receptor protein